MVATDVTFLSSLFPCIISRVFYRQIVELCITHLLLLMTF